MVAVGLDPQGARPVLLLREVGGRARTVPVLIGLPEAGDLEIQRHQVRAARPQTHELICDVIEACGRRLERVRITELRDGIYHAELVLDQGLRVSSRLTDAVALALRLDLTIEAEEDVLEAGHTPVAVLGPDGDDIGDELGDDAGDAPIAPEEVDEFRRRIDEITPEDFED